MKIDDVNYVLKFRVPDFLVGLKYDSLDLKHTYGLTLVAVTRPRESRNILGINREHPQMLEPDELAESRIEAHDTFTCIGTAKSFRALSNHIES